MSADPFDLTQFTPGNEVAKALLDQRIERLERENARYKSALQHIASGVPRDPWHCASEALAPLRLAGEQP